MITTNATSPVCQEMTKYETEASATIERRMGSFSFPSGSLGNKNHVRTSSSRCGTVLLDCVLRENP